ncbi:glycoside hydrolase family 43 protein [Reichenbachiella agariperforans]|uniref:glycoside hydrolase family 43 protein n=1 Tax=Reichenbachiella agariperforans TaxID=156994 RepID=UPI0020919861|nr:glycoside hydrolase 43 family protein [Reichenbachiella agariperforans]
MMTFTNKTSRSIFVLLLWVAALQSQAQSKVWNPDNNDGTYSNPIIHADYSDPDICRVGDDFYMTASSFNAVPGLPILHSRDLVNWTLINHALPANQDSHFDTPQHGNGVWAPSIRYHEELFYIYWGDPDRGIFMVQTDDPRSEWSAPVLVKKAYGNIDACPLWDDDGRMYLIHAFAHSRAGVKSLLQVVELTPDGTQILDKGTVVFDGHQDHPTIEGPKFYKRNGYYYIFAPGGGVPTGWQIILRSKNIYGPYEDKIVLAQGNTDINGPHQGGWVELDNGESWFIHFQDKGPYGRVPHLQPVTWKKDWPMMGINPNKEGVGEPVLNYSNPKTNYGNDQWTPQDSDEFDLPTLGLQWQWNANPRPQYASLTARPGHLQLTSQPLSTGTQNLWMSPNILTQKIPAMDFLTTIKLDVAHLAEGEETGLMIFGMDYSGIVVRRTNGGLQVAQSICTDAPKNTTPSYEDSKDIKASTLWLSVQVKNGKASYAYSIDGEAFDPIGSEQTMREGKWVGAKIALYASKSNPKGLPGYADIDWIRLSAIE